MNLLSGVFGRARYAVKESDLTALWNLLLEKSLPFSDVKSEEEGISFWVHATDQKCLLRAAEAGGIELTLLERRGLPALFLRYRRRLGLLIGGFVAALLLAVSSRVVWDVRIAGNERIPAGEIEALLKENGLSVGSSLSHFQAGVIENRVLLATQKLSWISVNLSGTVAYVQVMESAFPPAKEATAPANLVALADGQIETIQLYRGKSLVKVGQAVQKGELLVSGISDNSLGGFRYTRAAGEILAHTEREIEVKVPFDTTEENVLKREVGEAVLHFFGSAAKIYKRTGKTGEECAIIEVQKGFEQIGLFHVPVFLTYTLFETREEVRVKRSEDQVLELAYRELSKMLDDLSDELQLLEKKISTEWSDEGVILHCSIRCIENIAEQIEFEILP